MPLFGSSPPVALWAVRVLPSLAADGAFAQVLGMAAGSAIRVRVSWSRVLLLCLCAGSVPLYPQGGQPWPSILWWKNIIYVEYLSLRWCVTYGSVIVRS